MNTAIRDVQPVAAKSASGLSKIKYHVPEIRQYIPAQPGFFVLTPAFSEDDRITPHKSAVLAWGIEEDRGVTVAYPLTLEGLELETLPILRPDGIVEVAMNCIYDSLADWVEYENSKIAANKDIQR
jgi:hypothetical protein